MCAAATETLEDETGEFEKSKSFVVKFYKIVTPILTD